ncbi:MbcA/ParS/Xre antitoxin family protein [Amnimonas aquatica]|uniref:MbcA/ParS/Xre antitoxin family protein n=1 Tax=Amnimonas aquatica TaxID=2094561 RepID=UPI0011B05842|nr:MbcA/ParS/Xre antitoxin family protein [Amnimonas aquatica]
MSIEEKRAQELERMAQDVLGKDAERWLEEPHPVLAGKTPRDDAEQAIEILQRIRHGIFA